MTSRAERRFRPGLWATVALVPVLAVLIGLGIWQLDRLQWKQDLEAELRARREAPAITLPQPIGEPRAIEYRRVELTGRYLHARELYMGARPRNGRPGYHVITPFRLADGRSVLVNRGWVPKDRRDPATRPAGQPSGTLSIEGIVRRGGWQGSDLFRPANDPADNLWLWMDLPAMAEAADLETPVTEVYVMLARDYTPEAPPIAVEVPVDLPSNHLQYALTWFALAAVLLAIYILYHWRRPAPPEQGD